MVLLVSNTHSSLASVQRCALPSAEDGLCENCCAVVQQHRGWCRTFALRCRWAMPRRRVERSCSSAPALFTLTSVPVAAFDFHQAFRDSVWQHSPKLIRVCGDSCFERFWPLSGILLPLCAGRWMQEPQDFLWCLPPCAVLAPGARHICRFCFLLQITCCTGSSLCTVDVWLLND